MKKAFNLKKWMRQAFYDDARGHMQSQTRAWMNCYKQKCDKKKGPQEAWNTCLEEYQKTENKGKWMLDYAGAKDEGSKPSFSAKTPAAQKIIKE
jgi:hypothetical protein